MDHGQCTQEGQGSLSLQIEETMARPGPERKLTLLALRLAVLEKVATGLGAMAFVWATVVLLGGFAITLSNTDFWFITMILLIEGARILSRSQELEWQQNQTTLFTGIMKFNKSKINEYDAKKVQERNRRKWDRKKMLPRKWKTSEFPILPSPHTTSMSKNVSKVLYWLQLASATACTVLSLMKLIVHNYGEVEKGDTDKRNRKAALIIFYSLALAEALLFLLEKAYWEWKLVYRKLLEEVNEACDLGPSGMVLTTRFFYVAYSRCVNGSIFDGLKMNSVSFAMDLLGSNLLDEQLIGIRILNKFAMDDKLCRDTLRKIGTAASVVERLVKMLNWKDPEKEEIRQRAAEIISRLASQEQHCLRLSGIPSAMASISSLLENYKMLNGEADIHLCTFNFLGLLILKKLARDHDNCAKIGNTRGLLHKIIDFSNVGERLLRNEHVLLEIRTVKLSLHVLKMLASTTGTTGKKLRNEISENVFTISNIRDVLKYGEKYNKLQKLGIEILTCLAMEADPKEEIGGTGGILKELFNIFFKEGMLEYQDDIRTPAGEALAMLAFESKSNCCRMLKLKVIEKLVKALEVTFLQINAARILKNLCIYVGEDCSLHLGGVIGALPIVLEGIMSEENKLIKSKENKLQEVFVGLAANIVKSMTEESKIMFESDRIQEAELAKALVKILNRYQKPTIETPRIRRFVIELVIWMMTHKDTNVQIFKELGIAKEMKSVIETTTKLENFNIFSGPVGMGQDSTTIHSLVENAMKLLDE